MSGHRLRDPAVSEPTAPPAGPAGTSDAVATDDVRAIAVALGLGDHARPYSAHEVVRREILPAIAELRR